MLYKTFIEENLKIEWQITELLQYSFLSGCHLKNLHI